MKTKHTDCPWNTQLWKIGEAETPQIVVNGKSDCIAYVKELWPDRQEKPLREAEMEANARLIAAAPDLLAAAIAALSIIQIERPDGSVCTDLIFAIRKATEGGA